ncbi:hypothetical protein H257_01834 [Aphanomyces astaci]|uniref:Uncharacterized protein n=1 Tax=Aphanomyces astaci TaxID=112090 RepID=W4H4C3_APHAT|nr:hypothetical protein H257_01834 [Aphanomyces astaci]ETV86742.1 hypothetical protein H257_01834 [Aphanomyces astaci]|eukprot:XP_009823541.1 hypothetical protein H257_01834 [Aphanomyces astaci]
MAYWYIHLAQVQITNTSGRDVPSSKYLRMIEHQEAVIDQLIDHTKTMSERLRDVERQWKSMMRSCVAYMLLFSDNHDVDESAATYPRCVGIVNGSVERKLRALYKKGELDVLIVEFNARV